MHYFKEKMIIKCAIIGFNNFGWITPNIDMYVYNVRQMSAAMHSFDLPSLPHNNQSNILSSLITSQNDRNQYQTKYSSAFCPFSLLNENMYKCNLKTEDFIFLRLH